MKRFLNTLLQFVVLSIVLHLLFDIVGWLVSMHQLKQTNHHFFNNNLMGYVHVPRQIFSKVHFKLTKRKHFIGEVVKRYP